MSTAILPDAKRRRAVRGRPMCSQAHEAKMTPDERAARAFLMRAEGTSWEAIAKALGYTGRGGAYGAAMRYALKVAPISEAQRERERAKLLEMLEQLFAEVERRLAAAEDPAERAAWVERGLGMIERQSRLTGLEPSATPLAERLSAALQGVK